MPPGRTTLAPRPPDVPGSIGSPKQHVCWEAMPRPLPSTTTTISWSLVWQRHVSKLITGALPRRAPARAISAGAGVAAGTPAGRRERGRCVRRVRHVELFRLLRSPWLWLRRGGRHTAEELRGGLAVREGEGRRCVQSIRGSNFEGHFPESDHCLHPPSIHQQAVLGPRSSWGPGAARTGSVDFLLWVAAVWRRPLVRQPCSVSGKSFGEISLSLFPRHPPRAAGLRRQGGWCVRSHFGSWRLTSHC